MQNHLEGWSAVVTMLDDCTGREERAGAPPLPRGAPRGGREEEVGRKEEELDATGPARKD